MRVLFCTTGGLGHLLPLRPLASALRSRGHAVAWVTAPDACPMLEAMPIDLFPAGPTFEASRREYRALYADAERLSGEPLSAYTFPRLFGAVLAPQMLAGVEQAVRHWRPDVVVNEPAALAAPLVCRMHGLPQVTHGYGLRPPPEYLLQAECFFETHWKARGGTLPAGGIGERCLEIVIAPPSLQTAAEDGQSGVFRFDAYRLAARSPSSLPEGLGRAWRSSSAPGPRIYVTFGTVFNRSAALATAARAAARLGGTVVVTVGADGDHQSLADLGGHVHVYRFLDQAALLPDCDAVVSHGGAGTLLGAAAHGLPHLVLPQAADHFRNASALVAMNAGRAVEPGGQSVDAVTAALSAVLSDSTIKQSAKALAQEMARMPDAACAAMYLERWVSHQRS